MVLSRLIDGGLKLIEQHRMVRASGLFDAEWYASTYPECGGVDQALSHFLKQGSGQRYDPGPNFSMSEYLALNPDVARSGANGLIHYLRFGQSEGRRAPAGAAEAMHTGHDLSDAALARVEGAFDAGFYRDTNPDLDASCDPFTHFMGEGWRSLRDPAPWFSTEHYLMANEDVAHAGRNPFVHYLLTGCREGRTALPSRRPRVQVGPDREEAGALRTAVLAMVKNEADIIALFASHALALFDDVVVVDHMSDDGTHEFLAALAGANKRVECLQLRDPSYIQSVTMTHLVRTHPRLAQADWVFILDADEFLPFADRQAFHDALANHARCPVIEMQWRNLLPRTYWDDRVEIDARTEFLAPPALSPFKKVAFQPACLPLHRAVIAQGNHAMMETLNGQAIPAFAAGFPVLHLPVRSVDQLLLKLNQGVQAYQKMGLTRDAGQGTHWYQMKDATASLDLTPDILNAVVVDYSEDKSALTPRPQERLIAEGHRPITLELARHPIKVDNLPRRRLGELLMRIGARDFSGAASTDDPATTRLETTEEGLLIRADDSPAAEYAALDMMLPSLGPAPGVSTALADLMRGSYRDISDLVPSDFAGHIPFLFALTALQQPRRYVELGTLRGAGFFAFCQTAREEKIISEAVAVSSWAVEPEREAEYRHCFETFSFLARKYAEMAGFLRMDNEQASHRFADGSVDLLRLDGFSDPVELRDTLARWLPKLSSSGVLLLHDINAFGAGSGVWRIWEELKTRYPTMSFRHAQGLGVALVGEHVTPALTVLTKEVSEDASVQTLLQDHFERMGRLSAELFSRRYDMEQQDLRAGAEGTLNEELAWHRQELAAAKAEVADLREAVGARLRKAVGA